MQITNCGRGVHRREVAGVERLKALPTAWYAFTNLDLATGPGRSREIDVILVADDRIFLIDLKDWNGKIESDGGNWLHNGSNRGPSPVGKIHQNAKDVAYLLGDDVRRRWKAQNAPVPRVVGLVVITGKADLTGIAGTEIGSVLKIDDFLKSVATPSARVSLFGPVARVFVDKSLTSNVWKEQLSKFFNARTGKLRPGCRRYGSFVAASDDATFEHPARIFAEYDAADENAAQTLGTLRVWDFTKADPMFQSEEGRAEIAGRERSVVDYLRDRSEECENAILQPRAEDPDRGVAYWEVYDRRRRMKRLSDFTKTESAILTPEGRIELVRQLVSKVSALHAVDAAHLDIGDHSVWLEVPSAVKLSHLMAASYPEVQSLGNIRYQFLSSAPVPEDVLGSGGDAKRKDVFLLGVAAHHLIFGRPPVCDGGDMPPEWSAAIDYDGSFDALHPWFETALALDPSDRYTDARAALDAFNVATASRPTLKEVIEGLERFRQSIRSQKQLFAAFPETQSVRETDRVDIWKCMRDGKALFVKMWKRAAWGDQVREGPRILDFLTRAHDLSLTPPPGCARVRDVIWLGDAIALVQDAIDGDNLAEVMAANLWRSSDQVLAFLKRLTESVVQLHERRLAHGDLKPQNILVVDEDGPAPVLVDIIDFAATIDGDISTSAYTPAKGGRLERDRYAVTKIAEELLARCVTVPEVGANIARAIGMCRTSVPENGTLLPLIEAIDQALAPTPTTSRLAITLSIKNTKLGPVLPDEGFFYVRKSPDRPGFYLRGACQEIEITFDNTKRPVWGRLCDLDQKRIGRLSKFEFMSFAADISIISSTLNDLSGLSPLLDDPDFQARFEQSSGIQQAESIQEEESHKADAFEDAAIDALSEAIANEPAESPSVDVKLLWRRLVDAEGDLTTDGVAQADSSYNRNLKRHVVPFDLASGTFDFNRNDTVGVERLERKGHWRRIGELDIARSKPDRVVIDPTEFSNPNLTRLVEEDQRVRFTSHFEVQSLKRRETAISRILSRQSRIPNLIDVFDPRTRAMPVVTRDAVDPTDLARYKLNEAQVGAFQALLAVRPVGLMQGPPGTGKTVFIAALAHFALTRGLAQNILLASQSHEAVNNAAEAVLKLFATGDTLPSILRVGNEGVVSDRLLPFHTDRVEQLYKDRFRAEMRDRLRIGGRALGLSDGLIDEINFIEATLRPVAAKIAELEAATDPDLGRIGGLRSTLCTQIAQMGLEGPGMSAADADVTTILDDVVSAVVSRLPREQRVGADKIARLRTLAQVARDFVASVSTAQRGFETFLAGTRQIVAGTCVGLGRPSLGLTTTPFDLVIIDEAARCTASELSVPMQAGRWIVLVGDQAQLEPQHKSDIVDQVANEINMTKREVLKSDFERVFATPYGAACGRTLVTQYRMLPPIGRVVSETFYNRKLEHGRVAAEIDPRVLHPDLEKPITWVSTDSLGDRGFQKPEETGTSLTNPAEADVIVTMLKRWNEDEPFRNWIMTQTKHAHVIGIICMYAAQRDLIRKKVQIANVGDAFRRSIKIDTVDSYQGKENPVVVLSLVRNNADGVQERGAATIREGYLSRDNRINVAISRAMDRLVIVGSKDRWRAAGPMGRLSANVGREVSGGDARVIRASELPDDYHYPRVISNKAQATEMGA